MKKNYLVQTIGLDKAFPVGDRQVQVLKKINIAIEPGEFVILFGPSGCGKSTLLHCLLGLEEPTGGKVLVEGQDFYSIDEDGRAKYRKYKVGMIYQQPLWVRALDVFENVALPLRLLGKSEAEVEKRTMEVLKLVGMEDWAHYLPTELSSGQQQKVSLARALTVEPVLIAADEPTGNLDTVSGQELMEIFWQLYRKGKSILMITHDLEYLRYATRIFHMVDGEIVEEMRRRPNRHFGRARSKKEGLLIKTDVRSKDFLKELKI